LKEYKTRVLEILDNGDAVVELTDELINDLNWNVGDELNLEMLDDGIKVTNITKDNKNGFESKT
jgi:hypothetical protein